MYPIFTFILPSFKVITISLHTVWTLDNNSNGRLFLPTNSWRALKQRLLRTPELALVSLAGTRCSSSQIPVFKLSINPELISKFSQLTSCNRPSYCSIPLRTTSLLFFHFSWEACFRFTKNTWKVTYIYVLRSRCLSALQELVGRNGLPLLLLSQFKQTILQHRGRNYRKIYYEIIT